MLSTKRDTLICLFYISFCFCLTSGHLDVAITEAQVVTDCGRVEVLLHQLVCGEGLGQSRKGEVEESETLQFGSFAI